MKIVINKCFGGFSLSDEALTLYNELTGKNIEYSRDIERHDQTLIYVVRKLGKLANGPHANLKIIEIEFDYSIEDYDGKESVCGTWRSA